MSSSAPPPPPPPPPLLFSGFSDDPADAAAALELEDFDFVMDTDSTRAYGRAFVARRLHRLPDAAAVLQQQRPYHHHPVLPRTVGEPPAAAAAIAALPTVAVAEPPAVCAICKDDLPVASEARKLPCAHLYHSACIVHWLQMHNSCPVCRFRIPHSEGDPFSD